MKSKAMRIAILLSVGLLVHCARQNVELWRLSVFNQIMRDYSAGEADFIVDKQIACDSGSVFIMRVHVYSEPDTVCMVYVMSTDSSSATIWPIDFLSAEPITESYYELLRADSLPRLVDTGAWWQRPDIWDFLREMQDPEMSITRALPPESRR
jgi:hypothetical protein